MLWTHKYQPLKLKELVIHKEIVEYLHNLIFHGDLNHLVFCGPPGSGKKTLIKALLRELYGNAVEKTKIEHKSWDIEIPCRSSKLEVELTTVSSNYHVELYPSEAGYHDKYVVKTIIKEMAKNTSFCTMRNRSLSSVYKTLILNDLDELTKEAQQSLQTIMEKYSTICRLIMCCNNTSKVTEEIYSRCIIIR